MTSLYIFYNRVKLQKKENIQVGNNTSNVVVDCHNWLKFGSEGAPVESH